MATAVPSVAAPTALPASGELDVHLNVYDLGHVSKWVLNSWASRFPDLGVFHVGVEVLGVEFCFQALDSCRTGKDADKTGLTWHCPKSHPRHVFRESVALGTSRLRAPEIQGLLRQMEPQWPAKCYNPIRRNCVDFAEQFVQGLQTTEPFPAWVHGLAKGLARNTNLADMPVMSKLECSKSSCSEAERSNLLYVLCNSNGAPEASLGTLGSFLRRGSSTSSLHGGGLVAEVPRGDGPVTGPRQAAVPSARVHPRMGSDRLQMGLISHTVAKADRMEAVSLQCSMLR